MIVRCVFCRREMQTVTNNESCYSCDQPMVSIDGEDDGISPHLRSHNIPDDDAELPLDFMFCGIGSGLRIR